MELRAISLLKEISEIHGSPIPLRAKRKEFVAAVPGIPILQDYSLDPGGSFWERFPRNRNMRGGTPFKMDVAALRELAILAELSSPDMDLLEEVVKDIEDGADLKVKDGYVPTQTPNARSAVVEGKWVTDEVAKGLRDKIFAGPFDTCPRTATVNSLQTAPKPNGKVRIILNMSAPKKKGVNQSINKKDYPAEMGGMVDIVRALNFCGVGAIFFKCDWVSDGLELYEMIIL